MFLDMTPYSAGNFIDVPEGRKRPKEPPVTGLILVRCLLSIPFARDDRGSIFLRNVGELLPDYTASHFTKY
jgi:hypothetical protein